MDSFDYNASPVRVVFGAGSIARLAHEIAALGCKQAFFVSTPGQQSRAEEIAAAVSQLSAETFSGAAMHTPVQVTDEALDALRKCGADCLVSIGGGSTTGLAKALALRTGLPQIAVPTTYAGSEMTAILGQTADGVKTTLNDRRVLPKVAIYDVELTLSLPVHVAATSGINAIAHAVEALYARNKNPLTSLLATEGIAIMSRALRRIVDVPEELPARSDALYAAWLCATCLASTSMALHHKLCHTLGGSFGLPHAETHAAVLPHVVAYNASADKDAMASIGRALDRSSAAAGLFELGRAVNASMALRDLGLAEHDLDQAAELAVANPYWNPREVERTAIRELLQYAWAGDPEKL